MAYTIGNGKLFTGNEFFNNAYVEFESGKITRFGDMNEFTGTLDVDVKGSLVMPAWVNAHTHIYSTLARGMSVDFNPLTFTQILEQLWWKLDRKLGKEEVEISALAAAAEFIHHGVATVFDHHSSPSFVRGSLETLKKAIVDVAKMRGIFCYEVSDRDGIQEKAIEENVEFYEKYKDDHFTGGMMGLHASFTLSDETLEEVSKACEERIPVHVHVAEGIEDEINSVNEHGMRIIDRFDKYGLLLEDSLYAHCIHVSDDEIDAISESKGMIAVNPQSNMNNAVGLPNVVKFLSKGVKVVLGNDGFGFSPTFGIRLLALTQKHMYGDPTVFSMQDLKSILRNNYILASKSLECNLGKIEIGAAADLMVIDYDPPTVINSDNFYDHLFFGVTEAPVRSLYVGGRAVMEAGEIKTFDESEVRREARKIAQSLWKKM